MQGIYTYIPETNHALREHFVATILMLLFMVRISLVPVLTLLYLYVSTFRSMCAVSSLTSWFPGMLLTYFLNDFDFIIIIIIVIIIIIIITSPHLWLVCCVHKLHLRLTLFGKGKGQIWSYA
jgi:glycerol-3-phosphate acyltransferase PlsY